MLFTIIFILLSLLFFYYKGKTAKFTPRKRTYRDIGYSQLKKSDIVRPIARTSTSLMSRDSKATYLQSPAWKALKAQRLLIANSCCEHCYSKDNLHLHHITYERLGKENINDLRILCANCHSLLHHITGKDRLNTHHPILLLGIPSCNTSQQQSTTT